LVGWMYVWNLNPEGLGLLWLMASGTWGGFILAEGRCQLTGT
jgi:hypothetical protein